MQGGYHHVRHVSLRTALSLGDSGSWVVQGSRLCGFLIAGSDSPPCGYMVTIEDCFRDIKSLFGENSSISITKISGSPYLRSTLQKLDRSIREIHEISRTDLVTIHVQTRFESLFATYHLSGDGRAECIALNNDNRVFAVASLFKPFIAVGIARIIDDLSISLNGNHKQYADLRGSWEKTFTEVFNHFSDVKIAPLAGDPTVENLLVHYKGVDNMTHILFAPDGSPLLSQNDFRDIVSQFTIDTRKKHNNNTIWATCSNENYILLALLIQVVSKMSLPDFLKKYVFEPLGMEHIYMTEDELKTLEYKLLAKPYTVSANGVSHLVVSNHISYFADTIKFAVASGYISVGDYGIFFQAIFQALFEKPKAPWFNERFAKRLLTTSCIIDGQNGGYTPCGIMTQLYDRWPGSHSFNQSICQNSLYKDFILGKRPNAKAIKARYLAGSATGWTSSAYLMPEQEAFIIVLTNTSGALDTSDLISKLWLSEIFDLQPAKYINGKPVPAFLGPDTTPPDKRSEVHYVELARLIYAENSAAFQQLEAEDSLPDTRASDFPNICGTYVNIKMRQSLQVFDMGGALCIKLIGSRESGLMRFVRIGRVFRICSFPRNNSRSLSIDCFGAWRNRDFEFKETDQEACLLRKGLNLIDRFIRTSF
ncbi:beta-lactamase/transpeptidase-like protein [Bisporella sp. PMI_857]|nr:beta-lactamase/transpeptidase-like protein [Bisporella sp. PMI_857]